MKKFINWFLVALIAFIGSVPLPMDKELEGSENIDLENDPQMKALIKSAEGTLGELVKPLNEKIDKSVAAQEKMQDALNEIHEKSMEARADRAIQAMNDDHIHQALKYVAALKLVADHSKEQNVVKTAIAQLEKAQKTLFPELDHAYRYDIKYHAAKSGAAAKAGMDDPDLLNAAKVEKSAMATTTAGAGLEFLVTVYNTDLIRFMNETTPITGKFNMRTISGGSLERKRLTGQAGLGTYLWSQHGAEVPAAENTQPALTGNLKTGNVNFNTFSVMAYHEVSWELALESAVDVLSEVEREIALQIFTQRDNGVCNGSKTTLTDLYVDTGSNVDADNVVNKIDGLRVLGLNGNAATAASGAFDFDEMRATRENMGRAGDIPGELSVFASRGAFYGMLDSIQTWNLVGAAASIITGAVAMIDGIGDVQIGGYAMTADKTTSAGKFDTDTPANNTKESLLIVNRSGFEAVQNRGVDFLSDIEVKTATYKFSGIYRNDFAQIRSNPANGAMVGYYYNIT